MDPEVCLRELSEAMDRLADVFVGGEPATSTEVSEIAQIACDRFEALDGWLRSGGFIPADWRHGYARSR